MFQIHFFNTKNSLHIGSFDDDDEPPPLIFDGDAAPNELLGVGGLAGLRNFSPLSKDLVRNPDGVVVYEKNDS